MDTYLLLIHIYEVEKFITHTITKIFSYHIIEIYFYIGKILFYCMQMYSILIYIWFFVVLYCSTREIVLFFNEIILSKVLITPVLAVSLQTGCIFTKNCNVYFVILYTTIFRPYFLQTGRIFTKKTEAKV